MAGFFVSGWHRNEDMKKALVHFSKSAFFKGVPSGARLACLDRFYPQHGQQ